MTGSITFAGYTLEDFAGGSADGDEGPALAARFHALEGVATAPDGSIYLADATAGRLRRIDNLGIIHAFAQQGGWKTPYGLAVDLGGNLYVADYGNRRIRRVALDGTITTVAATGLKGPRNVAVAADGSLYVSDFDAGVVYRVASGGPLTALAITGLASPAGLALDSSGALFIADSGAGVVHRYANGKSEIWLRGLATPTSLAVNNSILYVTGRAMTYTFARLTNGQVLAAGPSARDLSLDGKNRLLLTAGDRLLRIEPSGAASAIAGPGPAPGLITLAREAQLDGPIGIATDTEGNVYIAEESSARIRRVDRTGMIQTATAPVEDPVAVVPSAAGLVVAEFGPRRVRLLGAGGTSLVRLAAPTVREPRALALDSVGNLYVADTAANQILRLAPGGQISLLGEGLLLKPSGLAIDTSGGLLVADSGHHAIRRYDPATGTWRNIAGVGTAGNSGDGGPAILAQLNFPIGVASGDDGSIYIADTFNHLVRRVSPTGSITTIAAAPALDTPSSIAVGLGGELFVADLGHNRVVRLAPDTAAADTAVFLTIQHAATAAAGPLAPGQLFTLSGDLPWNSTELFLDGLQAPLLAVEGDRAFAQVPASASGRMTVEVRQAGALLAKAAAEIQPSVPAFFRNATGHVAASTGAGAVTELTRDSLVTLYATGEGVTGGAVRVRFTAPAHDAVDAPLVYAGPAGWMAGILQINLRVPSALPPGEVSIELWVGEVPSDPTPATLR